MIIFSMSLEVIILALAWILTIILLVWFVPRNQLREAQLIFLFKQLLTWLTGLTVAEYRLIEYPVRLFSYANRASFTFEYFVYPSLCIFFNLHYPEGKSIMRQGLHYFYFCTGITIVEVLLERYTYVIKYIHWTWYLTWITLFITFYLSRLYYRWFFKLNPQLVRGE